MARLLDVVEKSPRPLLWVDDTVYSVRLLAGGAAPWLDPVACVAFRRKAVALLGPGVATLPVSEIAEAWVASRPDLRAAMTSGRRTTAALRALLADTGMRQHLVAVAHGLCASMSALPLVLVMPSPRRWVGLAARQAAGKGSPVAAGADEVDAAAVYMAEFLRDFAGVGVDALLLEEEVGREPETLDEVLWYEPVFNVGAHYRWDVGIRLPVGGRAEVHPPGSGFVIAPRPPAGTIGGMVLGAEFWSGEDPAAAQEGGFLFVEIPGDAKPELVLDRLASLRG